MSTDLLQELRVLISWDKHTPQPALLLDLAPVLPQRMLSQAISIAMLIEYQPLRADVLRALVDRLPQANLGSLFKDELIVAQAIVEEKLRAGALVALAPYLSEPFLQEALESVRRIEEVRYRAEALALLAPALSEPLKEEVVQQALGSVEAIEYTQGQVEVLAALAPSLPVSLLPEVLEIARGIKDTDKRARALVMLIPYLSEPLKSKVIQQTLKVAQGIEYIQDREEILAALIPSLSEPLKSKVLEEALELAGTIEYEQNRVKILVALIPYLSEPLKSKVVQQTLKTVGGIEDEKDRTRALVMLAPSLSSFEQISLQIKALEVARAIRNKGWRASTLAHLVQYLPESLQAEVQQEWEELVSAGAAPPGFEGDEVVFGIPEIVRDRLRTLISQIPEDVRNALLEEVFQSILTTPRKATTAKTAKADVSATSGKSSTIVGRQELSKRISQQANISQKQAASALEATLDVIRETLQKGNEVRIVGFGSFKVRTSAARKKVHPRDRRPIQVPAKERVRFSPGQDLARPKVRKEGLISDEIYEALPGVEIEAAMPTRPSDIYVPSWSPSPDERTVNTGFASLEHADKSVDRATPLACNQTYYFWLEIGPPIAGAIDEVPTSHPLPTLPGEAKLEVALFDLTDDSTITIEVGVGELQLQKDGSVRVLRQPIQPPGLPLDPDLLTRLPQRLFFPVKTQENKEELSLLCNIYYAQILIQSWSITASVERNPQRDLMRQIFSKVNIYTLATTINPACLGRMDPHRLSLMLNSNADNTLNFCFCGSTGAELFKRSVTRDGGTIQQSIEQARGVMRLASWGTKQNWQGETYRYGDGERNLDRLREDLIHFAIQGFRLYDIITEYLAGHEAETLAKVMQQPGLVQIALNQSPRYVPPMALIYDYRLDTKASLTLCPAFVEAFNNQNTSLEEIPCFKGACPTKDTHTTICPSGFWGYRHALGMPLTVGPGSDLFPDIAYQGKLQWTVGVSTDLSMLEQHIQALQQLQPNPPLWNYADTRAKTLTLLKTTAPHLVYFYCHGGFDRDLDLPYIRVGAKNEMPITREDLLNEGIKWRYPRPLVFINGCHTTAIEPEKAVEFVSAFIGRGDAVGVIGTDITIFEQLACSFAKECLSRFLQGGVEDVPIGEAVRRARLAILQAGNPLGLVYIPFVLPSLRLVKQ